MPFSQCETVAFSTPTARPRRSCVHPRASRISLISAGDMAGTLDMGYIVDKIDTKRQAKRFRRPSLQRLRPISGSRTMPQCLQSGRHDSNVRPLRPERIAHNRLPTTSTIGAT